MGTPAHYSSELPKRLGFLVDRLYPIVETGLDGDNAFGGALGTTFLLAMATPMIVLPLERILRSLEGKRAMADDIAVNPHLSQEVARVFAGGQSFAQAPFARLEGWSYVEGHPRFDIADRWPATVLEQLNSQQAQTDIGQASTAQVMKDLRNALSHGGITYLNADGHHIYGEDAVMLGFAADQTFNGPNYNIIRVTETAFRLFLSDWSAWLSNY